MLVLDTIAHETIWGGEKLLPYSDGKCRKIGHLYSLYCEKDISSQIRNGKYQGMEFQAYFTENKDRFGLGQYNEFPLIIALVEAADNLSIQVHPNDEIAAKEENAAYGKNESWYFLSSPESGYIYNGCCASSLEEMAEKIENSEVMSVAGKLPVNAGDYVYVEAGTLHALTKGSFLYEIEENSPWTYRLYDYDRMDSQGNKRELHKDKGLEALNIQQKSQAVPMGEKEMEERRYIIRKIENRDNYSNDSSTLECVTLISGELDVEGIRVDMGTTVVLEPGESITGNIGLAVMARPK